MVRTRCRRSPFAAVPSSPRRPTRPPAPVNFTALCSTLEITWTKRVGSTFSQTGSSGRSTRNSSCPAAIAARLASTAELTITASGVSCGCSWILPAVIRDTSSRSSMSRTMCDDLTLHHGAHLLDRGWRIAGEPDQFQAGADRRQRVAQLVRQHRQELVLPAIGLAPDARDFQQRVDAGHQLARAERLDQVVVGAGLQALDPRLLAGSRREQNDGDGRQRALSPQRAHQAEAVELGHHHVGEHQIGRRAPWRQPAPPRRRWRLRPRSGRRAGAAGSRACRRCRRRPAGAGPRSARRRVSAIAAASRGSARVGQPPQRLFDVGVGSRRRMPRASVASLQCSVGRCAVPVRERHRERGCPRRSRSSASIAPPCSLHQLLHQREADAGALDASGRARPRRGRSARTGAGSSRAGMPVPVSRTGQLDPVVRLAQRDARSRRRSVNLKALESRLSTIFSHMSRST